MLHLSNSKHVEVSLHDKIRKNKLYLCTCDKCGADRGYKPKSYKAPLCNGCASAVKERTFSWKQSMSKAAIKRYNDPNWKPIEKIKKGHHKNKTRLYTKIRTPLQTKLSKNMRCLLNTKLRNHGTSKFRQKTFDIIGYSVDDLIAHLQSKFEPWMNWENYGEWEIDHIEPDSSFNYSSISDPSFKESWKLSNLQPLEKSANASKGAKKCPKQ
jgi:hypothetical protein